MTLFGVLVALLLILTFTGWPAGFVRRPAAEPILTILVAVGLVVLLILGSGIVRY
jgi:hypothetical protein